MGMMILVMMVGDAEPHPLVQRKHCLHGCSDFLGFYLQGLRSDVAVSWSIIKYRSTRPEPTKMSLSCHYLIYYLLLLPFHTSPHHDHFQAAPWHLLLRISTWNHNGFHVGSPPDAMSIHDGSTIQVRPVLGDQTCRYPSVEQTHRYSTTKCPTPVFIASI